MTTTQVEKMAALAAHLELEETDEIQATDDADESAFEVNGEEYLVLTDAEADERAIDYIKDSVWAFNASFLASYTDLPEEIFTALQDKCEGANDVFLKLIERTDGGIEGFSEQAMSADGRGHFMSSYDGKEHEEGEYFIYRTN